MAQSLAQSERQALCNLLEERGPLAPTLCEGWTTSDLAAHLFVRDSRPLALPGILLKSFAGVTEREMEKAKRELGYGGLIRRIRSGPPLPIRVVDSQVNLLEYFVHHEDLRRSEDGWEPRQDTTLDAALWPALRRGARLMARRLRGAGLELAAPAYGSVVAREGAPLARVSGAPQELVLLMFGRGKVARVEVEGPDAARSALDAANFRI
ncbi:MAG: TIGR03085 family metal-binding protein [Actinomycetota bacterium]|jgi:uncharacterized protein (TIGR03085 family)|nr:TIGR03085 family metal-binding protein [Actinomycetota bacterium]